MDVQGRVRLAMLLFRAAMPRLAGALADAGEAPPRPTEKERLLGRLEEAAWDLDEALLEGSDDEDAWHDRVLADARVDALLRDEVAAILAARRERD